METEGKRLISKVRMRDILPVVAEHYGVTPDDILGKSRKRLHATPRHAFCWICKRKLEKSYPDIGRFLNRDHTTIIHSAVVCRQRRIMDWETAEQIYQTAKRRRENV